MCTSITSHIICDITMALLKYNKYIEAETHSAGCSHANNDDFICVNRMAEGL